MDVFWGKVTKGLYLWYFLIQLPHFKIYQLYSFTYIHCSLLLQLVILVYVSPLVTFVTQLNLLYTIMAQKLFCNIISLYNRT